MINIIDTLIAEGNILPDEYGNLMLEKVGCTIDISNLDCAVLPMNLYELKHYHDSIASLWEKRLSHLIIDTSRRNVYTNDKECITMLQVLFRDDILHLIVTMRSCDILDKFGADIQSLQEFAEYLKNLYNFSNYAVIVNIGSMHLYIEDLLKYISNDSNCQRRHTAAIVADNGKIVSYAINNCSLEKCIRQEKNIPSGQNIELCGGVHAETYALLKGKGDTMFSIYAPCATCASNIIHSGIKKFYYIEKGSDSAGKLGMQILIDKMGKENVIKL